eukprot:scaffold22628_cov121-Isochrysis_galbana.AAC.3
MQIALVAANRASDGENLRGLWTAACRLHVHVPPLCPATRRRQRRTPHACRRYASAPGSALNKARHTPHSLASPSSRHSLAAMRQPSSG